LDEVLDEALTRTFPASDPVAIAVTPAEDGVFQDNAAARRFELKLAGGTVIVEYEPVPGALKITHTEVPKALEGRGLASRVAALVVAEARRRGVRLTPVCPFFAGYIKKHTEHHDLVHPDYRASLGLV
jgi:predicted GNAT family acetyltransferase